MVKDGHSVILDHMGIQAWLMNTATLWSELEREVSVCQRCPLSCSRTQTVFGVGPLDADLCVVGEAPGFYEDKAGQPFVGRAGQLLNQILNAIGLDRSLVFIANILKCRPPDNRDPNPEEINACYPYLLRQLALVKPKLIVTLGRYAAKTLLNLKTDESLNRLRSRQHRFSPLNIPLIVSYHPAYLLRNPIDKKKAYHDWLQVKAFFQAS